MRVENRVSDRLPTAREKASATNIWENFHCPRN